MNGVKVVKKEATYQIIMNKQGPNFVRTSVRWERRTGKCKWQFGERSAELTKRAQFVKWLKKYDLPAIAEEIAMLPK